MSRVQIEIDALVFHGLPQAEAREAGAAFTAELERLVLQRGLTRPARVAPAPSSRPVAIGRAAAAMVHARLAR